VENGKRMMEILTHEPIDLVALELSLRGEDGLRLARRLREISTVPIIIVTRRAEEADRVMGLELGADDYVTKPYSTRELLARIRAVIRRYPSTESPPDQDPAVRVYHFVGWDLNMRLKALRAKFPSECRLRLHRVSRDPGESRGMRGARRLSLQLRER
jgi:two-component system, OmpR family, response regulator